MADAINASRATLHVESVLRMAHVASVVGRRGALGLQAHGMVFTVKCAFEKLIPFPTARFFLKRLFETAAT